MRGPHVLRHGDRHQRRRRADLPDPPDPARYSPSMTGLALPIGLGFAARGSVSDAVAWAEQARRFGFDSVWIHDSYFERDAVSYASAIASQVPDIRVALGAVNPFTRHPVLIAMTVSALDEMAPERIVLGLGSALPLRLA